MTPDQWHRAKEIFGAAIEKDAAERVAYVRDAAAGDEVVLAEVMSLLETDSDGTLLRNPLLTATVEEGARLARAVVAADDQVPRAPDAMPGGLSRYAMTTASGEPSPTSGELSGRIFLRFEKRVEAQYAAEYFKQSLPRVRGALLLAIFLYAIFGFLDSWVAPEQTRHLWLIRLVVVSATLIAYAYSFSTNFSRYWQILVTTLVVWGALGIIGMIVIIPAPANYLYSTGLLLLTIYYCTLMRVGFLYAAALSLSILLLYNAAALYAGTPFVALVTNDMMLVAGGVIALSANLAFDRHNRRDFLQRREIAGRTHDLKSKNDQLSAVNAELVRSREEILRSVERNQLLFAALTEALPGTVLEGKYRLDEKIGAGGFGTVYRGFHLLLEHPVAVKLLKPAPGDALSNMARFRKEGIAACRLAHPNAVQVLDFGVAAGSVAYLVMELLDGRSLAQEIEACGRMTFERCATIVRPLCEVLAEAHRAGLIHRDLKPSNVFLHRSGSFEVVKIIDFGLAKIVGVDDAAVPPATVTVAIHGTPAYMAPERLTHGDCNDRADVYSMGVMVCEILSGERPLLWHVLDDGTMATAPLRQRPRLSVVNALVPEEVVTMVERALEKDPRRRPTIDEFGRAFKALPVF